jgi:threonine/homoserine/homoserine lactone efflux protein
MPGPVSAVTLALSMRRGFWAGPLVTAGHAVMEGLLVAALALGLGGALHRPQVLAIIGCVGGTMLLWMGTDLVRHALRTQKPANEEVSGSAFFGASSRPIRSGVVTSLANPYWFLWWATLGTSYVVLALQRGLLGVAAFYTGHILSDLSWNSVLALVGSTGRRALQGRLYQGLFGICGLFLLGLGAYFLWTGIGFWVRVSGG